VVGRPPPDPQPGRNVPQRCTFTIDIASNHAMQHMYGLQDCSGCRVDWVSLVPPPFAGGWAVGGDLGRDVRMQPCRTRLHAHNPRMSSEAKLMRIRGIALC